jgi:hypothetical protein
MHRWTLRTVRFPPRHRLQASFAQRVACPNKDRARLRHDGTVLLPLLLQHQPLPFGALRVEELLLDLADKPVLFDPLLDKEKADAVRELEITQGSKREMSGPSLPAETRALSS